MQPLGLNDIRSRFLAFFQSKGHLVLPSASLVPQDDPSILLINAGMTPFKPYFTGAKTPPSRRIATCQKCIRTPDIERVGQTSRHGTFFEMFGNFSFGDYFKKDAIVWAWSFLTEELAIEPERLYVSVYETDDEAYALWRDDVGLAPHRIVRLGKADNFWEHGVGPCGPCSEIYFDRGPRYGCDSPTCAPGCDCDRYVELWNLVFTQFNREDDGSYTPLKQKNIDTGGGLERLACALQGVDNLFEVDTIRAVLDQAAHMAQTTYGQLPQVDRALRVVTDHVRSAVYMLGDGIVPGNEGRGYVLRRLIRRAVRFGQSIGMTPGFLTRLAPTVIAQGGAYASDLLERQERIERLLSHEEMKFAETLSQGLDRLSVLISEAHDAGRDTLSGEDVFTLHDTYGFPLDLSVDVAREANLSVDVNAFETKMAAQKAMAREALKAKVDSAWDAATPPPSLERMDPTVFLGYETLVAEAEVCALYRVSDGTLMDTDRLDDGDEGVVVLSQTPFYAEAGGQKGDVGRLIAAAGEADVRTTTKTSRGVVLHHVVITGGVISRDETIKAEVDRMTRLATARNHTTTHLLHSALRAVLGDHVEQAGSEVTPHRLRFDFTHGRAMTDQEKHEVERRVNAAILADTPVTTEIMDLNEAKARGAMALFNEAYGDRVRVVTVGDVSCELCGGTHLARSSQAGCFRLDSESSIASGVRRIEAVTGADAVREGLRDRDHVRDLAARLKVDTASLDSRIDKLLEEIKGLKQTIASLSQATSRDQVQTLIDSGQTIDGVTIIVRHVDATDGAALQALGDALKGRLRRYAIVLVTVIDGALQWLATVDETTAKGTLHAGQLIQQASRMTGGHGGGRAVFARGGGGCQDHLTQALETTAITIQNALTRCE